MITIYYTFIFISERTFLKYCFEKLSSLQKTYKRNQGTPIYTSSSSSIFK